MANSLEQFQYVMSGLYYSSIFLIFLWKKKEITSNYNDIQTDFIKWSKNRGINPNKAYDLSIQTLYRILIPCLTTMFLILSGPFLAAVIDKGNVPLDDRSHFPLFWPKVSTYIHIL